MRLALALAVVALAVGCEPNKGTPNRDFPPEIEGMCYRALDEAEAIVLDVGEHEVLAKALTVSLEEGTLYAIGFWQFVADFWGLDGSFYAGGVTSQGGNKIVMAHNPEDRSDVNYDVLLHEMLHHWLLANGHNVGHHPAYYGRVKGWR